MRGEGHAGYADSKKLLRREQSQTSCCCVSWAQTRGQNASLEWEYAYERIEHSLVHDVLAYRRHGT
jgi:hypothetical protein